MFLQELRIVSVPSEPAAAVATSVTSPAEAVMMLRERLGREPVEVFVGLYLTTTHRPIGYHEVSRGSLDATIVHPREVFKPAVLRNAAAVIVAHNHPSGDPTPSSLDVQLTKRLRDAGQLLGIDVLDHIVIGHEGRYFSFREVHNW